MVTQECQARVNCNYIDELQSKFQDIKFERTEKTKNRYITNFSNKSTSNDLRIFIETQIRRLLRSLLAPFLSKNVKSKLSYFSQEENKDKSKIYKFDDIQDLQEGEKYAIQNVDHATQ
ncbi:MAG: hypothetical protein LBC06_03610, partial [Rickettsiales bacterium]|nr:hypothetical protein [Rickettsiales bacterium]